MTARLENLVLSGLVALIVSTAVSGANTPPTLKATHGISTAVLHRTSSPSLTDIVEAQGLRIDALQNQLATTKRVAQTADTNIRYLGECISGSYLAADPETGVILSANGTEPGAFIAMVLSDKCPVDIVSAP